MSTSSSVAESPSEAASTSVNKESAEAAESEDSSTPADSPAADAVGDPVESPATSSIGDPPNNPAGNSVDKEFPWADSEAMWYAVDEEGSPFNFILPEDEEAGIEEQVCFLAFEVSLLFH